MEIYGWLQRSFKMFENFQFENFESWKTSDTSFEFQKIFEFHVFQGVFWKIFLTKKKHLSKNLQTSINEYRWFLVSVLLYYYCLTPACCWNVPNIKISALLHISSRFILIPQYILFIVSPFSLLVLFCNIIIRCSWS